MRSDRDEILAYVLRRLRASDVRMRGLNAEMNCPSCGGENKFAVHVQNGVYGCFRCGIAGTLRSLILGVRTEWSRLVGRSSTSPTYLGPAVPSRRAVSLPFCDISGDARTPSPLTGATDATPWLVETARKYTLSRGVTPEQITKYRIGVRPYVPRVFFPYWDDDGQTTFWMGRSLFARVEPKTVEPGGADDKPLYGKHVESCSGVGPVFLVEGVFDHFATPQSYAVMGSNVNDRQIADLKGLGCPWVCVVFDPDAMQKAARAASKLWAHGIPAAYVRWSNTDSDPAALGPVTMAKVIRSLRQRGKPTRIQQHVVSV